MKKAWFDIDRLIFAGKTCLVASILMGIILVGRASYSSTPTAGIENQKNYTVVSSKATTPAEQSIKLSVPTIALNCTFQLEIELAPDHHSKQANAFSIRLPSGKHYLVSLASLLKNGDWEQITRTSFSIGEGGQPVLLQNKPLYVGPFTEDHQPNLLQNPDLGLDLAAWSVPITNNKMPSLTLAVTNVVREENVWIVGIPDRKTNTQPLYHAKVLEQSDKALSIQPIDRVSLELIIGLPVVNQLGEVVGNVLGGNDLVLIGASAPALRRRLISINPK